MRARDPGSDPAEPGGDWHKRADGLVVPGGSPADAPAGESGGDLPGRIEQWATRVGAVAGSLAGLVIVVHVLGGVVMWLRFKKAGLPPDQGVALVSREQMLIVGMRLMVLPTVATGLLAVALLRWQRLRGMPVARTLRPRERAARALAALLVLLVLFALVPRSGASATWLALVIVWLYWRRGLGVSRRPPGHHASPLGLAAVAVLAAAVISLGRQIDEPVQLLQVTADLDGRAADVQGIFVNADGDALHVGLPAQHQIRTFRRSDVKTIALGPPLSRAPERSALSRLLFDERWAVTPPFLWCDGERYWLFEVWKWCRTQPLVLSRQRTLDLRWIPVRVFCPEQAGDGGCRGYLRATTARKFGRQALGPFAASRRVSLPHGRADAIAFEIPPNRARELCIPTSANERFLLWNGVPEDGPRTGHRVDLIMTLSTDPESRSVLAEKGYRLDAIAPRTDPSLIRPTECSRQLRARDAGRPLPAGAAARAERARVTRVLDGETVEVRTAGGLRHVRLVGIEAPTTKTPGKDACGELAAKAHVLERVFSDPADPDADGLADGPGGRARDVTLTRDPATRDRDPDSLLLRRLAVADDRETVQESLLSAGWAIPSAGSPRSLHGRARMLRLARGAQRSGRGIHRDCGGRIDRLVDEP